MKRALDLSSDDEPLEHLRKKPKAADAETTGGGNSLATHEFKVTEVDDYFWVVAPTNMKHSAKIAAFDMDWTLIYPKSGKKFPVDKNDWAWWPNGNAVVKNKLKDLVNNGYRIVVFTNQAGIEKGKEKAQNVCYKIIKIANDAGIPLTALICGGKNKYRKPFTCGWELFQKQFNGDMKIDSAVSFFVGDAAGRAKNWKKGKKRGDFNCSDRKFAVNLGLTFHTPDEYFLGESTAEFDWGKEPHPSTLVRGLGPRPELKPAPSGVKEMVVMVGYPGCGKSTIAKAVLKDYVWINQDTHKSRCKKLCENALKENKRVVIDNTNPGTKKRGEWISLAKKYGFSVRCFWVTTGEKAKDWSLARHMNAYRTRTSNKRPVPKVAYHSFKKKFAAPTVSEGFETILEIPFEGRFPNHQAKQAFAQWMPDFR